MTAKTRQTEATDRAAIIYCRVSTNEQADSGLGLEAQQRRCEGYCQAQGWTVGGIFIDAGLSASTLNRPELEKAIAALTPGAALVVLKLDRLTRTVADLAPLNEQIEAAGAEWATVQEKFDTSTATGRLMLRMMLELSQWEREVIGERTSAALQQNRARRERLGTTPLGYRTDADGKVTADGKGQATVKKARELRTAGLSLREIAARLVADGHTTARGGKWEAATVAGLLRRRYIEEIGAL
jgi:DNA invertase Pin-like site-specific DNA recombinase